MQTKITELIGLLNNKLGYDKLPHGDWREIHNKIFEIGHFHIDEKQRVYMEGYKKGQNDTIELYKKMK